MLTVPTGRLPLKAHDGTASHAPATSADLSHLSANLQGKPGQLNIQTNMKQMSDFNQAAAASALSPFTNTNIQPKSVLNQSRAAPHSIFHDAFNQPFSPNFQNLTFQ